MPLNLLKAHLWLRILIGMVLGIVAAIFVPFPNAVIEWVILPGDLFIALLKMVIVPLVLSSVILGVASAGSITALKKVGFRIIPYFIMTTAVAITIGLAVTSIVKPGLLIDQAMVGSVEAPNVNVKALEGLSVPQRILNVFPVNPAEAQLNKNMLQLVILGVIVGIALLSIQTKAVKTVEHVLSFTQDASMMVVNWAMWLAPLAVFSLMIKAVSSMGVSAIAGMGIYMACVIVGLLGMMAVHVLLVAVLAKRNPLAFLAAIRDAQVVAFSTSSSAATMPVSLRVAKEKLDIREDIRGFVIPLGATINMDGTALYQAVAALFLCQVFGIDLSLGETLLLLVTTIGASIGTPALPGVGLIVLATILSGIGVPPEGVGLILGVDRLLDMCRTTINVTGDLTASAVMERLLHPDAMRRTL
ncbi:MAG: dicarboxylate/amino acid:cation symporter [Bdellovibrionales bacterium]